MYLNESREINKMKLYIVFKLTIASSLLTIPYITDQTLNQQDGDKVKFNTTIKEKENVITSAFLATNNLDTVRFTSYWVGDGSSADMTSSGLNSHDFEVNNQGWYTYQDKVVLASATDVCLESTTGACGKYNELPEGYNLHSLFDELVIHVDGVEYDAIILDSCGASFWNEEHQRYDLYIADVQYLTDMKGHVEIKKPKELKINS